jgi:hypothetical protein
MYFAVDPIATAVPGQIAKALQGLPERTPVHLFALLDGAFDESLVSRRPGWSAALSLYEGTRLQALVAAAPHLLPLPSSLEELQPRLERLFARCAGKPMLSVLASAVPAEALRAHLRPYLIARTPDTLEWPVRWADTRVLPSFLDAIGETTRRHLLAPLHGWWSTRRDGTLAHWEGGADPASAPAEFDWLPLDDRTFGALVDASEPDAVLSRIFDLQPDVLRQHTPSRCHRLASDHLALATRHGLEAAGARQHFVTLALCLREGFWEHAEMADVLRDVNGGITFEKRIEALSDQFWRNSSLRSTSHS